MYGRCFGLLLGFVLLISPVHAQDDLGDALDDVGQQYANNYSQPVTDALGASLNAGLFRTAAVGGDGVLPAIDIYVGVAATGALTAGLEDSFRLTDDPIQTENGRTLRIEYPDADLPTVFGKNESPGRADIVDQETGLKVDDVALPSPLTDAPIAPVGVPQVGIGTLGGTDAQLRYLPGISIRDYGSVSLLGLSVRHSLSQYIPSSPVSLAVQSTWQRISISGSENSLNSGEIISASGWALNAQVSKSVPVAPITFYGGVQYEQFGVEVNYTFAARGGTSTVAFEQEASNNVRALAGVSITLAVIQLNVDYALGSTDTVSAGVGIVL